MSVLRYKFYISFCFIVLILGAISMLLPFFFMITLSVSPENQILSYPPVFIPHSVSFDNFSYIFTSLPLNRYFFNSFLIAFLSTVGQVFISSFAGYAFARFNFKFKEFLFLIVLLTMMVPPQVNIIPLFFLMRELHWTDTFQALIFPGIFGGFGVFMFRQYFKMIPKELEDAAKIDGCSHLSIFFKTALPLALPAITSLSIFTFISSWNSFMWPLIITSSDSMRTLPVGLSYLKAGYREVIMWGQLGAFCVICSLPVILLFLFGRKFFINDVFSGSIKE